ncbi:MAG: hypothetical protein ACOY37_13970 [Pseudomonadota bacterium]
MKLHSLALVALLVTAPAMATTTGQPAPAPAPTPEAAGQTPAASPADPDEKVCKVERELGSNKLKRVCRTRAQLDAERDATREALSREQRR